MRRMLMVALVVIAMASLTVGVGSAQVNGGINPLGMTGQP